MRGEIPDDAREGGCSGCIEVGAFGKEAYVLTGYLNVPKILEATLHNGVDPVSGRKVDWRPVIRMTLPVTMIYTPPL